MAITDKCLFFGVRDVLCYDGYTFDAIAVRSLKKIYAAHKDVTLVNVSYWRMFNHLVTFVNNQVKPCNVVSLPIQPHNKCFWTMGLSQQILTYIQEHSVKKWCVIYDQCGLTKLDELPKRKCVFTNGQKFNTTMANRIVRQLNGR